MSSGTLVNFSVPPEVREWFKNAAHAERLSLSAWLRKLAVAKASELLPDERPTSAT